MIRSFVLKVAPNHGKRYGELLKTIPELQQTRYAQCTKHRLATCDGSAPHGAMSLSISMSMGGAGPRGYQQVFIHNLHPCFPRR